MDQALERKVARHEKGKERLIWREAELLQCYLMRFGAGRTRFFEVLFDGLALRLPHLVAYFVVFKVYLVARMQVLFVLLLRGKCMIVGRSLAFSRFGDAPEPAAHRFRLP